MRIINKKLYANYDELSDLTNKLEDFKEYYYGLDEPIVEGIKCYEVGMFISFIEKY